MTYLAWSMFLEGNSDKDYFEVLIPRVIEELVLAYGVRAATVPPLPSIYLGENGRSVAAVAEEICGKREAFHLVFIHADTGGRSLQQTLGDRATSYCHEANTKCGFPVERCIQITPRHEMEAWALADSAAVLAALGYRGSPDELGLPKDGRTAEQLQNPKEVLRSAVAGVRQLRRRGRAEIPHAAIAQRQSLSALRKAISFRKFESDLRTALASLGCI